MDVTNFASSKWKRRKRAANIEPPNIEITARARAFRYFPLGTYRFLVGGPDDIQVWDDIAGHFTNCHSLSESAKRRIWLAARAAAGRQE